MPILKSAIKKLKQSEKRREQNRQIKGGVKRLLDAYKKKPTPTALVKLTSALDKAAKTNVIHKNKASRLKSRLSKLLKK
ncbi:MAG: 30S ribosomal protein S20 [Patescibacteria group bacterium]|nr:30S ribosomal protein S20 [Patescibacteria group bacterium]MCL5431974.1 30S ribosomal protein S20 [Patescibacteria group bacterium]